MKKEGHRNLRCPSACQKTSDTLKDCPKRHEIGRMEPEGVYLYSERLHSGKISGNSLETRCFKGVYKKLRLFKNLVSQKRKQNDTQIIPYIFFSAYGLMPFSTV